MYCSHTYSGVVPEYQCPVAVEEGREFVGVCEHSSDVGTSIQCPYQLTTTPTVVLCVCV